MVKRLDHRWNKIACRWTEQMFIVLFLQWSFFRFLLEVFVVLAFLLCNCQIFVISDRYYWKKYLADIIFIILTSLIFSNTFMFLVKTMIFELFEIFFMVDSHCYLTRIVNWFNFVKSYFHFYHFVYSLKLFHKPLRPKEYFTVICFCNYFKH